MMKMVKMKQLLTGLVLSSILAVTSGFSHRIVRGNGFSLPRFHPAKHERSPAPRIAPLRLTGSLSETLAGAFFPLSLPPYLAFLYFASYENNGMPKLAVDGFKFLLGFVLGSIPAAVASSVVFDSSLADCDWLHGSAESLLTITNLLIVLGFELNGSPSKGGGSGSSSIDHLGPTENTRIQVSSNESVGNGEDFQRMIGILAAAALVLGAGGAFAESHVMNSPPAVGFGATIAEVAAIEPSLFGLSAHTPFLAGFGDLSEDWVRGVGPAVGLIHEEPSNALSIPTWVIHISSLIEWLAAMALVWNFADVAPGPMPDSSQDVTKSEGGSRRVGNSRWKGLTWGMLPLHSSGLCACTYHLFYNQPSVEYLLPLQAFLTVVGNSALAFAAFRLAVSNGWTGALLPRRALAAFAVAPAPLARALERALRLPGSVPSHSSAGTAAAATAAGSAAAHGLDAALAGESASRDVRGAVVVLAKLAGLSVAGAYAVKYGELALDWPFDAAAAPAAAAVCIIVPSALNVLKWTTRSKGATSATSDLIF